MPDLVLALSFLHEAVVIAAYFSLLEISHYVLFYFLAIRLAPADIHD